MWAVWRQDARRLAVCFAACLAGLGLLWNDQGNATWIPGLERGFLVRWLAVFGLSMCVGVVLGLRDRVAGTRENWIQRPVSAGKLFASRALGGVLVVLLAVLLVMVASWLGLLDHRRARRQLWSLEHAGAQLAWLTCLVPGVAAGFALSTVGGPWLRSAVAASIGIATLCVACLGAAWWRLVWAPGAAHGHPLAYAIVQIALSLPVFALAASRQVRGADRDHGRAERWPALAAGLGILVVIYATDLGTLSYADAMVREIDAKQPWVWLVQGEEAVSHPPWWGSRSALDGACGSGRRCAS